MSASIPRSRRTPSETNSAWIDQVTYAWIADDATNEPDYDEVEDVIKAVA